MEGDQKSNRHSTKTVQWIQLTRPDASDGLWASFLLPCSIIVAATKNYKTLTPNYKLWTIFACGLMITSLILRRCLSKRIQCSVFSIWNVPIACSTGILFHICLKSSYGFSLYSGILCSVVYHKFYFEILKAFPKCFTLGEAAIVAQGMLLFFYSLTINVCRAPFIQTKTNMETASLIIQLGLFGVFMTYTVVRKANICKPERFYLVVVTMLLFIVFLPLHVLLLQSPVLWIVNFITSNTRKMMLFLYWAACSLLGGLAVSRQIWYARRATTSVRKIFHILLVMVFLPGLVMSCTFLYLAMGVVLGIFIALELLRVQAVPPIGQHLQDGYAVFRDEKDTGVVALTPIYLLVGCALPLWIHPSPCDVTDSTAFTLLPLLGGLLSIGIGDTAASVIGSRYGLNKWKGTNKSIEGTFAYILSQMGVIGLMVYLGYVEQLKVDNLVKLMLGIGITGIVEAKTTQIDNLILPLIMFMILI